RSTERVEKALGYIRKARESGGSPLWRTVFLEGQILAWLDLQQQRKKGSENKTYRADLRALLPDPATGPLTRARKGERPDAQHPYDVEGLFGSLRMAAVLLAEDSRTSNRADIAGMTDAIRTQLDVSEKIRATPLGKASTALIASSLLSSVHAAQLLFNQGDKP